MIDGARSNFRRWKRWRHRATNASRRELIKSAVTLGQIACLSRILPRHVAGQDRLRSAGRVIVVGAGFAGLCAAYQLQKLGYEVNVFEARDRVGGRVLSFNNWLPQQTIEGGGELVGLNHPRWWALAREFGLELIELPDEDDLDFPIILDGKSLRFRESQRLYERMDEAFQTLNALAASIDADRPWLSPNAQHHDLMSIEDWLNSMPLDQRLRTVMEIQLSSDNGVTNDKASFLGLLTAIRGGGLDDYWSLTETHRCRGGNQQLASKLAEAIGRDRIHLAAQVSSIESSETMTRINLSDGSTHEADDIIVAIPSAVWSRIKWEPALPSELVPQAGEAIKYLARLKSSVWRKEKLASELLTDEIVSQTWEATDPRVDDGSEEAVLVGFSGGAQARRALELPIAERDSVYRKVLDRAYEGFDNQFVESRMMDWPNERWTGCGYSFPAPGQITQQGQRLQQGIGKIHFAGEHTCYGFVGYMEGALKSGFDVSERIATRDRLARK